ncbi:DNA cytosine methyltransferase [Streptacidiphilus jiangxiensis]|uniref:DNA (Cytosine-5)-methyltransferase 1 n=1 Tax=Streptacidiphilus jiangxiensis TaxID=235985 RepID=A0A1H8A5M4_STRJI|nr:DNA cytosine methyltransferase [Streptacidiphilus jiangxiensis]SEM65786.1 DNA (cytosine-5)-methyltransferase 1 [Streptacidiphilus jiangxiensis]
MPRLSSAGDLNHPPSSQQMGPWNHDELARLAHPWPIEWLFPPKPGDPPRIINLFAGAGGWEQSLSLLDGEFDVVGVEIGFDAAATAVAAGHRRIVADVRSLDPGHLCLQWAQGLILSAPCQVWTPAGKRAGHTDLNLELLLDTLANAFDATFGFWHDNQLCVEPDECGVCCDPAWDGYAGFTGALMSLDEARAPIKEMTDERIGLIAETLIWSLSLTARYDQLRWLAMEQSSALPEVVLDALANYLEEADWADARWQVLDAVDYGLASRRKRTFLVGGRHMRIDLAAMVPSSPVEPMTAARALGWPAGIRVNTRGNRKTSGGNEWPADRPAIAITSKMRGWYPADDPTHRFPVPQGALLVGMPATYPWTGSRSSAYQQLGDLVTPPVGAAVLGPLVGRQWESAVADYLADLYGPHSQALAAEPAVPAPAPRRRAAASAASPMLPGLEAWSTTASPTLPGLDQWTPAAKPPAARRPAHSSR